MDAGTLANLLDGRQLAEVITREEARNASKERLVVVFVDEKDECHFRGAIHDSETACLGTRIVLDQHGVRFMPPPEREVLERWGVLAEAYAKHLTICVRRPDNVWRLDPSCTHHIFRIFHLGSFHCQGVVLSLDVAGL